jgi:hypothetical protein
MSLGSRARVPGTATTRRVQTKLAQRIRVAGDERAPISRHASGVLVRLTWTPSVELWDGIHIRWVAASLATHRRARPPVTPRS